MEELNAFSLQQPPTPTLDTLLELLGKDGARGALLGRVGDAESACAGIHKWEFSRVGPSGRDETSRLCHDNYYRVRSRS